MTSFDVGKIISQFYSGFLSGTIMRTMLAVISMGMLVGCQSIGTHQIGIRDHLDRFRGYPISMLIKYPEATILRYEDDTTSRKFYLTTINNPDPKLSCDYIATARQFKGKTGLDAWIVVDIERTGACAQWPTSR